MEVLGARLLRLLEAATRWPERPIGSLEILSAAERRRILEGWNDTARALPPATLPALFAAQALRTPEAVAVVFEGETLSYGALERRANQLAHRLRKLGAGPESVVGLFLERSLEMIVGLLGILKAGAAYLPLDPDYPQERLAFMLADSSTRLLVTSSALRPRLGHHGALTLCLDAEAAALATEPASAPELALDPQHPAYVIYTSGSTGRPKGVVHHPPKRSQLYAGPGLHLLVGGGDGRTDRAARLRRLDLRDLGRPAPWRQAGAYAAGPLEYRPICVSS